MHLVSLLLAGSSISLSLPVALAQGSGGGHVKGVAPENQHLYAPSSDGTWSCRGAPSVRIPHSAINDDYCDCPSGSDEPGTSACSHLPSAPPFYCANAGHISGSLLPSRVGDGICDYAVCCDGSDEAPGVCPDRCEEMGRAWREEREREREVRRRGGKVRSGYVKFARGERRRLEGEVGRLGREVEKNRIRERELKAELDRLESVSAVALEAKKSTPLYAHLISTRHALSSLRAQTAALEADIAALRGTLADLRASFNPNYQDMGVLAAVREFEAWEKSKSEGEEGEKEGEKKEKKKEEGQTVDKKELDELEKADLVSLLLSLDSTPGVKTDPTEADDLSSILFQLESYLPPSLLAPYHAARETLVHWLVRLGIVPSSANVPKTDSPEITKSRKSHASASDDLRRSERELERVQNELDELVGGAKWGVEGEWKKLKGECVEKEEGDYIYELCFFEKATQKPLKNGAHTSLGRFKSWHPTAELGTPESFSKQVYDRGSKCWNGPERNVKVSIVCGESNALLAVAELERCEYSFEAQSPALCVPEVDPSAEAASKEEGKGKDEL